MCVTPDTSQGFKALGKQSWQTLSHSSCKHLAGLLSGKSGSPSVLFTPPARKRGDGSNKESRPVQAEQQGARPQWAEKQAQVLSNALQLMKMSQVCTNPLTDHEGSVPDFHDTPLAASLRLLFGGCDIRMQKSQFTLFGIIHLTALLSLTHMCRAAGGAFSFKWMLMHQTACCRRHT